MYVCCCWGVRVDNNKEWREVNGGVLFVLFIECVCCYLCIFFFIGEMVY